MLFSVPPSGMITRSNGVEALAISEFGTASKLGPKNPSDQLISVS